MDYIGVCVSFYMIREYSIEGKCSLKESIKRIDANSNVRQNDSSEVWWSIKKIANWQR